MSTTQNVTILTPRGHRMTVKAAPNTTILDILEQVCKKYELSSGDYDLKHHKTILDVSSMFRFSGLPNNALLEMIDAAKSRIEADIFLALQLEDGSRLTGTFKTSNFLIDVLKALVPEKSTPESNSVIIYMRKEVYGQDLESTSLRSLGLSGGRAIFRLIHKKPEELKVQANVSSPLVAKPVEQPKREESKTATNSFQITPSTIKSLVTETESKIEVEMEFDLPEETKKPKIEKEVVIDEEEVPEPEIIELGERNAVLFSLETAQSVNFNEIPDSFFDLTVEDVRKLLKDIRKQSSTLTDAPMLTAKMREIEASNTILKQMTQYHKTVIRVQFPDRYVLQGTFTPVESIGTVMEFIRPFLKDPKMEFYIFSTPPKTILDPETHLIEAKCVPQALLHFGTNETMDCNFLKNEIIKKSSSASAAILAAAKSRGLYQKQQREVSTSDESSAAGGSGVNRNTGTIPKQTGFLPSSSNPNSSKPPRWFKPSGK